MGLIGAIGVVRAIERLKSGRSQAEMLSIADITMVSVNGSEAYKNLPLDQYQETQALYNELKNEKEKKLYSLDDYLNTTTVIIMLFDSIAPFELYCGSSEVAANIRSMKQDPSFYEMRDMVLKNPDILSALKAIKEHEEDLEEIAEELFEEADEDTDDEEDAEYTGFYEYYESYVIFAEGDKTSDAFDADLDADFFLREDSACLITIDGEGYPGAWKHDHDDWLDFSGFETIDKVVLRGLSSYLVKYEDEELYVYEDIPEISGIRLKHVFTRF